jgi:hypothetical protein
VLHQITLERRLICDSHRSCSGAQGLSKWVSLFWRKALYRLARTDLSEDEQLSLICEMVGKGARLPTSAELDELARGWPGWMGWLSHNKLLKRAMERCAPVGSP